MRGPAKGLTIPNDSGTDCCHSSEDVVNTACRQDVGNV